VPQRSLPATKPQSPTRRATSFEPLAAAVFGEVIRAERVRLSIAQDQFALLANVDRSYYGKLERGERQPSLALILRIAGGLGIAASDIIALVEERIAARK
jgi:transcriptional regulator with XRE-family HTH domain